MTPTLLVLAAGMGTRYGGLKQIDSIGPNGETIIDYSIYDGIRAGFGKVVFVIRHYFEQEFREKVSSKFDRRIETAYAYQEMDACLGDFNLPRDREKPWGTGHAILVCGDLIHEPFAVVNADDYYGVHSLGIMAGFLATKDVASTDYGMVGFVLRNTLSEYGPVSRGVCQCDEHMMLRKVVERKKIERIRDGVRYLDTDGQPHPLTGNEIISMNLWGFLPSIFPHLHALFDQFLRGHGGAEPRAELYIPSAVDALIGSGKATVKVLRTDDTWFGVTYRPDRDIAVRCMRALIDEGVYPERLWG
jgi:dTDP-glucose pyrophosphorylase